MYVSSYSICIFLILTLDNHIRMIKKTHCLISEEKKIRKLKEKNYATTECKWKIEEKKYRPVPVQKYYCFKFCQPFFRTFSDNRVSPLQ